MKKISTSDVTSIAQMPFKAPSLDFLQDAYKEQIKNIVATQITYKGLTYSATQPYWLYGRYSIAGPIYTFTDGAILYNGELFTVASQSSFKGVGTALWGLVGTASYSPTADPTTFSDLSVHNIHQLRGLTLSWVSATPSDVANSFDLSNVIFVENKANQIASAQGYKQIYISGATTSYSSGSIGFDTGSETFTVNDTWRDTPFTITGNKIRCNYGGSYKVSQTIFYAHSSITANGVTFQVLNQSSGGGAALINSIWTMTVANQFEQNRTTTMTKIVKCSANDVWDIQYTLSATGGTVTSPHIDVWFQIEYLGPY